MDSSRALALRLTIRNAERLDDGAPLAFVLDRRGGVIGRAASCDWTLPDPERHISSRHCEVRFSEGMYELVDTSTNGTFLNGTGQRLSGPHRIASGDVITVGRYEIVAELASAEKAAEPAPAPVPAPAPASAPAEATPVPAELAAKREQMWTMFELSNAVDWSRGGFGTPAPAPPPPPEPEPEAAPAADAAQNEAGAEAAPEAPAGIEPFLHGAEMQRSQLKQDETAALTQAGMLLRRLVAGLVVMLEARARAKSQMGAQSTGLEIEGNNPLKFARSPEQALQYMLNPQERGFMSAERAVEDAFRDLQAHQLATLRAMQGALRATLDRFSPKAIRSRADTRGLLARLLPGSRDAALWKAYETEFSGVAFDSDEAFMDIFSRQFRQAYDEIARQK
jgi:type VI secretion system FHA domain protein